MTPGPSAAAGKSDLRERSLASRRARPEAERATGRGGGGHHAAAGAGVGPGVRRLRARGDRAGYGRLPAAYTQLGARVLLPVVPRSARELAWAVDTGRLAPGASGCSSRSARGWAPPRSARPTSSSSPRWRWTGPASGWAGAGATTTGRWAARPDAVLVAVVFDDEFVDEVPAEPHDHRVHAVVTPSGGWQALPVSH